MGSIIFLIAMIVEIAFAVFCIITKSNQQKIRNIIRVAAFTAFILFTILSIIEWSTRYYSLASLLLLLSIFGVIGLIKKDQKKRVYKTLRVIIKAIAMTLLIFIVTLPSIIFPQYKKIKPTGKYQVTTVNYTYTDKNRIETYTTSKGNRKLNVEMWYPKNVSGTYPLIVFSHGAFGIKTSNETLFNELASHGYVVCSIDHTYQSLYTTDTTGHTIYVDKTFMNELITDDAENNKLQSYEYYQEWMKIRTDDISFLIDYILKEAKDKTSDTVYKLVDTAKIGVMGHSLGGSSALGIGRMRKDVSAVAALESPFLCDIKGVTNGEFDFVAEKYPIPVLNVYSDSSWGHLNEWPQYVENSILLSNTNLTAFNIHIKGVGHLTLTDLALSSPILTRIFNGQKSSTNTEYCLKVINKVCLKFFDCYLKGEGEFKESGTY